MLFAIVEGCLDLALDDAEEDILSLVIVWCDLLALGKVDVYDHELVIVDDLAKLLDFRSDHNATMW